MPPRSYAEQLQLANRVTQPAIQRVVRSLELPAGSRGIDVGCGAGLRTLCLADAAGVGGEVVGLDISAENLAAARAVAAEARPAARVDFVEGDLLHLPFADGSFDWLWCADTLWPVHVVGDPVAAVRELARVVKPGGTVALVYWSGQGLLPGHPGLEARLNAAFAATTPYLAGVPAHRQYMRALGWMREAGLEQGLARTCVADIQAPVGPRLRESVAYCFEMFWGGLQAHVSADDWDEYRRLCDPASEGFILDGPDYYGFVAYTVFRATAAARRNATRSSDC